MQHFLVLLILMVSSFVHANDFKIENIRSLSDPLNIGVSSFTNLTTEYISIDLQQVVTNNLTRYGHFETLDEELIPVIWPGKKIDYADWRVAGVEYFIVGSIEKNADEFLINYALHDVKHQRPLISERIPAYDNQIIDSAHFITDRVYETLTGIKGAFSTRLAYVTTEGRSSLDKTFHLMLSDADGGRPRTIFKSSEPLFNPAWSPDGSQLAYTAFKGDRSRVYLQNIATGQIQVITDFEGMNTYPVFSPSGDKLALTLSKDGSPAIFIADLRSGKLEKFLDNGGINYATDWSPDGSSLLVTSITTAEPAVLEVELSTRRVRRLSPLGSHATNGIYTPDGRSVVFVSMDDIEGTTLYRVLKDEPEPYKLITSKTMPIANEKPAIAPNGTMILFQTDGTGFGLVSLDGKAIIALASNKQVSFPTWSPFFY